MKRKSIALSLAVLMLLSTAGCGKKETEKKSGENIELSWFTTNSNMPEGGISDIMGEAAKQTGITLKSNVSKNTTDYDQAFTLMMSSGNLADVISIGAENADKYGRAGALVALDGLIEKNAPDIKKYLDANPDVKRDITAADGHIYYLPFLYDTDAMNVSMGWFVREDWINKLGLKDPTNVDEYYQTLKAFKEKDPNGNGKADEVPFYSRANDPTELLVLWGAEKAYYIKDGKIKFGPSEPEYKTAFENVSKWYKEGLIDQEIYTRSNPRDALLGNNQGGSCLDWIGSTYQFNDTLKDKINGFNIKCILPPKNANGQIYSVNSRSKVFGFGWSISSQNKYPEDTMKFFNYWFTDRGRILANYGLEDKQYDMVDGKPKFKDELLHADRTLLSILLEVGVQWTDVSFVQDFDYEKQWLTPDAVNAMTTYQKDVTFAPQFPVLSFTEEEQSKLSSIDTNINTRLREITQQWVLGQVDVDTTFDSFVSELNKLGLQEAIQIRQTAYDRYMKN